MVKKSSRIGVAVKLKQEKDKTSFTIVDSPPSMFIFLSVGGILYSLLNRSKYTEMMNEVKKFIETEPEFK